MTSALPDPDRRRLLKTFVNSVTIALAGSLTGLLGAFALPRLQGRRRRWVRAARLDQLKPSEPHAAVVTVRREQGWYREQEQEVVFLTWDGQAGVRAMSATCTHLGCRVRWDVASKRFQCPCHGGAYDVDGTVVAGPPPKALARLEVKLDESDGSVMVRL